MTLVELDNLVRTGQLKKEPGDQTEFDGLVLLGRAKLKDAANRALSPESRFDLACNAAHAFSLAALRWHGYRSDKRFVVFQAIPHTLSLAGSVWRVLATAHKRRNDAEYEGNIEMDSQLLEDLLSAAEKVGAAIAALGPVPRHT